ncbi:MULTISPECIES: hypothetical protein [Cryobacterium]|nr:MULTISPECIES: hypothetical protein [Cryobacterium]
MIHPKRRRATYPAVHYSVAPFWGALIVFAVAYLAILATLGLLIQKGLSL